MNEMLNICVILFIQRYQKTLMKRILANTSPQIASPECENYVKFLTDAVCLEVAWRITGLTAISIVLDDFFWIQFPILIDHLNTWCTTLILLVWNFSNVDHLTSWYSIQAIWLLLLDFWQCTWNMFFLYTAHCSFHMHVFANDWHMRWCFAVTIHSNHALPKVIEFTKVYKFCYDWCQFEQRSILISVEKSLMMYEFGEFRLLWFGLEYVEHNAQCEQTIFIDRLLCKSPLDEFQK